MTRLFIRAFAIVLMSGLTGVFAVPAAPPSAPPPTPFSSLTVGGPLDPGYRRLTIPKVRPNIFSLVDDAGTTVLKVESDNSAGSIGLPFVVDTANTPLMSWRWKVNRVLDKADINTKLGDDYAARVYVFFDVPLASLSFTDRTKIRLARMVAGDDVPTAAICYVWDNKSAIGYNRWSPYTNRVRKIVLQSGNTHVNQWMNETRDVAADFRAAFGIEPPRVIGVAIGNDSDQTDEKVTTWFGDFVFKAPAK